MLVVVLILVTVGGWYWLKYLPEQEAKEQARLEQIAKEEAEKKRKQQAARRKTKYDQLIKTADAAFAAENWQNARSQYAEASSIFKNEAHPKDRIAIIDQKLQELADLEAKRAAGIIETITSRTGAYFVIVSSSIDDDLALDFAKKLARQGEATKLIEHDAKDHLYYRVAVANYDSREEAENAISNFNGYGEGVWVLKF